jgi:hypothetical protein
MLTPITLPPRPPRTRLPRRQRPAADPASARLSHRGAQSISGVGKRPRRERPLLCAGSAMTPASIRDGPGGLVRGVRSRPPQTPNRSRASSAASAHSMSTGQPAQ